MFEVSWKSSPLGSEMTISGFSPECPKTRIVGMMLKCDLPDAVAPMTMAWNSSFMLTTYFPLISEFWKTIPVFLTEGSCDHVVLITPNCDLISSCFVRSLALNDKSISIPSAVLPVVLPLTFPDFLLFPIKAKTKPKTAPAPSPIKA